MATHRNGEGGTSVYCIESQNYIAALRTSSLCVHTHREVCRTICGNAEVFVLPLNRSIIKVISNDILKAFCTYVVGLAGSVVTEYDICCILWQRSRPNLLTILIRILIGHSTTRPCSIQSIVRWIPNIKINLLPISWLGEHYLLGNIEVGCICECYGQSSITIIGNSECLFSNTTISNKAKILSCCSVGVDSEFCSVSSGSIAPAISSKSCWWRGIRIAKV